MDKLYHIRDFSSEELVLAKKYIKNGILGIIHMKLEDHINKVIEDKKYTSLYPEDILSIKLQYEFSMNNLLAAVGFIRLQKESVEDKVKLFAASRLVDTEVAKRMTELNQRNK